MDSSDKSDILDEDDTKEGNQVHSVGRIDKDIYKCITEDIITDEVILTDKQILHIKERHPNDYESVVAYISDVLTDPDYIIQDKHENTGLVVKRINVEGESLQVVLRLCTSEDEKGYQNSVISCWRISNSRLQNYLRNKTILYKKE